MDSLTAVLCKFLRVLEQGKAYTPPAGEKMGKEIKEPVGNITNMNADVHRGTQCSGKAEIPVGRPGPGPAGTGAGVKCEEVVSEELKCLLRKLCSEEGKDLEALEGRPPADEEYGLGELRVNVDGGIIPNDAESPE